MIRSCAIGGNGPLSSTVQGVPQAKTIVSPATDLRIASRKSPETPAPVPAAPPELVSVLRLTVSVAENAKRAKHIDIATAKRIAVIPIDPPNEIFATSPRAAEMLTTWPGEIL